MLLQFLNCSSTFMNYMSYAEIVWNITVYRYVDYHVLYSVLCNTKS